MIPIFILIPITLISLTILALIYYARQNYGKLNGLGIPVIPPTFLLGSVPDIHTKVQPEEDIARFKKYGPVWGLYQGRTPIIYIADPDLIRKIFVKDSAQYFYDRQAFHFGDGILDEILDFLPGQKWKVMRTGQTRLFSSGKIKQYSNEMFSESMGRFVKGLEDEIGSSPGRRIKIDTRERFCTYTIDAIGQSMLSMKIDPKENAAFYTGCKKLIGEGQVISSFYVWTLAFPFLAKLEPTLILDPIIPNTFRQILESRRQSGTDLRFDDYIDIMDQTFQKMDSAEYRKLGITETTILGQGVNLFLAGFDRISTIMTFLCFHLAKDKEAQAKLHEEIDNVIDGQFGGTISYESLSEMPFLNACISETNRLYPVFIRPERVCSQNWEDADSGIKIPKGVLVMIPSWAANRNPNVYTNPDEFQPERFLPGNKGALNPYAFTTFGFGHRNCIGMRFAYEAMRVGICHLFRKFKVELREDSKINFKPGLIMILQFDPVYLDILERPRF